MKQVTVKLVTLINKASQRKQSTFHGATNGFPAEIPYWWHVTTQIWLVLLIGWSTFATRHDQSEELLRIG